jgi:hypothetical protein
VHTHTHTHTQTARRARFTVRTCTRRLSSVSASWLLRILGATGRAASSASSCSASAPNDSKFCIHAQSRACQLFGCGTVSIEYREEWAVSIEGGHTAAMGVGGRDELVLTRFFFCLRLRFWWSWDGAVMV